MKHYFIINPAAGTDESKQALLARIEEAANGTDYVIYRTEGVRDATRFVRECCEQETEELRFYACGGDGTLNEVAEGAYPYPHASVTCVPCGSGNDFVKCFGGAAAFSDIRALMEAETVAIDLITANDRIGVNVLNFGFDTTVAKTIQKVRRKPIIGGARSYAVGVATALLTAMRTRCSILADGEEITDGKILLCTIANGQYVGGSFRCAPRAEVDDGLLEVCKFRCINHFRFLQVLKPYTNGEHLDREDMQKDLVYRRCTQVEVRGEDLSFSLDGEIIESDHLLIGVKKGALRFARP